MALPTNECELYEKFTETLSSFRKKCEKMIRIKTKKVDQLGLNSNIYQDIGLQDFLWSRWRHPLKILCILSTLYKMEFKRHATSSVHNKLSGLSHHYWRSGKVIYTIQKAYVSNHVLRRPYFCEPRQVFHGSNVYQSPQNALP